jgi:hypothetical protein
MEDEETDEELRAQLVAAVANVRRTIDELDRTPAMVGYGVVEQHRALRASLEAELANLD